MKIKTCHDCFPQALLGDIEEMTKWPEMQKAVEDATGAGKTVVEALDQWRKTVLSGLVVKVNACFMTKPMLNLINQLSSLPARSFRWRIWTGGSSGRKAIFVDGRRPLMWT